MKTKLFYLLVFLHEALFGQLVPDDISRMKNKMESMTNYSCDIQYKLYSRTIASSPIEVKSGFLLHNNQNSLFFNCWLGWCRIEYSSFTRNNWFIGGPLWFIPFILRIAKVKKDSARAKHWLFYCKSCSNDCCFFCNWP